ncbi:MAG: ADP-forming succinate--CoA ligase subunit beta [Planctomycetota bacterium]|nr:ADP-forming succinate--CoA ligase subunit beta [Planctomycetota bacterium]
MKIHEYQAKQLLAKYGLSVPEGRVCTSVDEVVQAYNELGTPLQVVKAQIHAGGRGKGGGVILVRSEQEAREAADKIMGMTLITHQTGPEGQLVRKLWIEQGSDIETEYYLGIAVDRETNCPVMMASSEGGMEIETVAEETPDKILKAPLTADGALDPADAKRLAEGMGIPANLIADAGKYFDGLAQVFCKEDCSIAEINPLVTTKDGKVLALDAKMDFDPNAEFRHSEWNEMRDVHEEDPKELEASKFGLSYIALDGSIGCMVNGAGLAMSTMDVIQLYGGSPANFLDVGGGATVENVTAAFRIILSDPKVEGVLVNIFGGIMKCDIIAEGVIGAVKQIELKVPLVVRLEGTNVELGRKMLEESGLPIIPASDLDDAAKKICIAVKGA